jgi:hypothetical protein
MLKGLRRMIVALSQRLISSSVKYKITDSQWWHGIAGDFYMKSFHWGIGVYIAFNVDFFGSGLVQINRSLEPVADGVVVGAEVIDVVSERSGESIVHRQLVRFLTLSGDMIESTLSDGVSKSERLIGNHVEIIYLPSDPHSIISNRFFSIWSSSISFALAGALLLSCHLAINALVKRNKCRKEYLQKFGVVVKAQLECVRLNEERSRRGRYPFVIECLWVSPVTGEEYCFTSDDVWIRPDDYIKNNALRVFIEKDNPMNYYVDLSFLPTVSH